MTFFVNKVDPGLRAAYCRLMKDIIQTPGDSCWLHRRQQRGYVYFYLRMNEGGPHLIRELKA